MAVASPPDSWISRATVEMVELGELGSGGNGAVSYALEVVFADTTTGFSLSADFPFFECHKDMMVITSIAIPGKIYCDLSANASRGTDD